jgi:hypothetical protein
MKMEVLEKQVANESLVRNSITYEKYYQLIKYLLRGGSTADQSQDESVLKQVRLNFHRMKRMYRTTLIGDDLKETIQKIDNKQLWVYLSDGWKGDVAQSLPAIARLVEQNEKIELRIFLKDENPEVVSSCLTNDGCTTPKLIVMDEKTKAELFTWDPKPETHQNLTFEQNIRSESSANDVVLNKTTGLQTELLELVRNNLN